ncbi:hypothetical protein [Brevundimonas subvibrioides]|uniref:hypothetical protein n=1 Tax=Brevundimonas subvibrioides TaxID=74313 RepID=UPI0022B5DCE2|nr:hypothetical protein [Brevundimonas subvibrioides]
MEDLFRSYWWLLFPFAGFLIAAWGNFLRYRRQKAVLDLIRSYVENGREPPASLVSQIELVGDDASMTTGLRRGQTPANYWSLVGLFSMMAAGFSLASFLGVDGGSGAFLIVALTMAAVAVWALICAVMKKRDGGV